MRVILTAVSPALQSAWFQVCGTLPGVSVHSGNLFRIRGRCDAVVSPANSFGWMDGGIDREYMQRFGPEIQERVQGVIKSDHEGELRVGQAILVETGSPQFPYLISAPTMKTPMDVSKTDNDYLAIKAALQVARLHDLESVAFPGMGTGIGGIDPTHCANAMKRAILE